MVVALVLTRALLGPLATRVLGGLLFAGGVGAVLLQFLTYWMPSSDVYVPALLVVAALGLLAVLSGGQSAVTWGGLSAAFGLLAAGLLAAESANLPGVGSTQREMFTVAATALGFLAVAAALAGVGLRRSRVAAKAIAGFAIVGAVVTAVAAYRLYPVYGGVGEKATMIAIGVLGALALLVLAAVLVARRPLRLAAAPTPHGPSVPSGAPPGPAPQPVPAPQPQPPVVAQPSQKATPMPAPATVVVGPSTAAVTGRGRLEFVATIVGLITGIIAIIRELVNLFRSFGG